MEDNQVTQEPKTETTVTTNLTPDTPTPVVSLPPKKNKKWLIVGLAAVVLILVAGAAWYFGKRSNANTNKTSQATQQAELESKTPQVQGLQLDTKKNYGDKYKTGILPVGDKKYMTDGGKKGYIYMCNANFVPEGQAGAQSRGPWFIGTTQWDINKKAAVAGNVNWTQVFAMNIANGKRVITTNALPNHITGTFPVASSDPAYQYDRNPSTIKAQSLTYNLSANPTYGSPQCMGGEVGVMLSGVPLFNGFDAGGRDAGAWEVQDSCDGHPQNKGEYHYHTHSRCIKDVNVNTVIGFALDGFPITGPKVGDNNYLTTDDLDECHGIVSEINLDNKKVSMYHYVMTQDFPYSVSCFRSTAEKAPGLPETTGGQQSGQAPGGNQTPPPPPRR